MKVIEKIKSRKGEKEKPKTGVVTQQNLEESREEILANGKKFRYPFQYAKHRLVISTIGICLVMLIVFVFVGWLELYKMQTTSDIAYRFTDVLGLNVAKIDGKKVKYSDYLLIYRSSVASIEYQQGKYDNSEESKAEKLQLRRQALDAAEEYSYAIAKLEEFGLGVSDEEINALIDELQTVNGERRTDETFRNIIHDNFGLNLNEYRHLLKLSIAKKKAAEKMDSEAARLVKEIEEKLAENKNMETVAEEYLEGGIVSFEPADEPMAVGSLDNGRAAVAVALKDVGDISKPFVSKNGDGYYIVKLTARDNNMVAYETIWIEFAAFDQAIQKFRDEGGIEEFIEVKSSEPESSSEEESGDGEESGDIEPVTE